MIRLLVSLLAVAVTASVLDHASQFQAFKLKHGKTYMNQVEEYKRFNIFKANFAKIAAHNARYEQGLETYTLAANKFADMTPQEFSAKLALQQATKPKLHATRTFQMPEGVVAPDAVDWRSSAVTPVKNQGNCGSCWAFSLTGSTEGAYALKTGNVVSLSEQQLVDCATDVYYGCSGGFMTYSFPYISKKGLQSESSYPYEAVDGKCRYNESNVVTRVDDYVAIAYNETALQNAVGTVGPVSVSINGNFLQFYDSGIFHMPFCRVFVLNHGVLAVGYGTENNTDYWIIKNSWGADWGDNGYFRFKRGVNECGIADDTVYPIIH